MKIKNSTEAREYIISLGIEIVPGLCYNIYECGHVYENRKDKNLRRYFKSKKRVNRCCPNEDCSSKNHKNNKEWVEPKALETRYKKTSDGFEQISVLLQDVKNPKELHHTSKVYRNKKMRDEDRWNCEKRPECMVKYRKYDAIPCKDCEGYRIGHGNVDIKDFSERRISS